MLVELQAFSHFNISPERNRKLLFYAFVEGQHAPSFPVRSHALLGERTAAEEIDRRKI
jgi:hypothetical protein